MERQNNSHIIIIKNKLRKKKMSPLTVHLFLELGIHRMVVDLRKQIYIQSLTRLCRFGLNTLQEKLHICLFFTL